MNVRAAVLGLAVLLPVTAAPDALEENPGRLETLQRTGISAAEAPVLHEMFDAQIQTLLRLARSTKPGKES